MDLPAKPDAALAQPTRARLFEALIELRRPASTEELAAALELHPNGVRLHLERLREAELVVRERVRHGRGRPRDMWTIAENARPGGEAPTAYLDLGRWLVRMIDAPLRDIEAAGRAIGRGLAAGDAELFPALVSMGFQPSQEGHTYRLRNCPYRDAVRENQDVVCTLHRGITRGLLNRISPGTELAGFVPRDPDTTGCLIELRDG
jgi:predicted ArsR family transcriptional regulator